MSLLQLLWPAADAAFPPSIVLNMPDEKERLELFEANNRPHLRGDVYLLSGANVGFAKPARGAQLKKGTLGNIESHRVAAELGLKRHWESWFVFEDDVVICPDIPRSTTLIQQNPFRLAWLIETIKHPLIDCINLLPYPTLAYHFGPCMVAAMMYNPKGARAAMQVWSGPQWMPSDNSLATAYAAGKLHVAPCYENYVGMCSPHAWVADGGLETTVA